VALAAAAPTAAVPLARARTPVGLPPLEAALAAPGDGDPEATLEVVRLLLAAGADARDPGCDGKPLLLYPLRRRQPDVLAALLAAAAASQTADAAADASSPLPSRPLPPPMPLAVLLERVMAAVLDQPAVHGWALDALLAHGAALPAMSRLAATALLSTLMSRPAWLASPRLARALLAAGAAIGVHREALHASPALDTRLHSMVRLRARGIAGALRALCAAGADPTAEWCVRAGPGSGGDGGPQPPQTVLEAALRWDDEDADAEVLRVLLAAGAAPFPGFWARRGVAGLAVEQREGLVAAAAWAKRRALVALRRRLWQAAAGGGGSDSDGSEGEDGDEPDESG
jgi:hypothetical protein